MTASVSESCTIPLGVSFSGHLSGLLTGSSTVAIGLELSGDLIRPVLIGRVRALTSTRIRIDFSRQVAVDSELRTIANYVIAESAGAVKPVVLEVDVPSGTSVRFVELLVSEMTQGVSNYTLRGLSIRDPFGVPLASDPVTFSGIGDAPALHLAIARSSTTVQVYFTEQVLDLGDLRNPAAYSFLSDPLSVLGVLEVDVDNVLLSTSEQTEVHLYTLEFDGLLYDYAMNAMAVPAETSMLGFIAKVDKPALLTLKAYNFIVESVRNEDQTRGNAFLERFLQGPQTIWAAIVKTIFDLPKLWSLTEIPDDFLPLQKNILGWTPEMNAVTDELDAASLRRLLAASAPFWKRRGAEDSTENIMRLVTGARLRLINWFELRFIVGETHLGVELDGHDPWLLSTPGEGEPDAWTYNIRVVDDGTINRGILRALARLTRPTNERVLINYLGFLDQFTTNDDFSQWDGTSASSLSVADGTLSMLDDLSDEEAFVNVALSEDWTSYAAHFRVRGTDNFSLLFYRTGSGDMYRVRVDIAGNAISLKKLLGGVETNLVAVAMSSFGEILYDDVYYSIGIEVVLTLSGAKNSIRLFLDGQRIFETEVDGDHAQGTLGIAHGVDGTVELDELEMFFAPAQTDFVDINS